MDFTALPADAFEQEKYGPEIEARRETQPSCRRSFEGVFCSFGVEIPDGLCYHILNICFFDTARNGDGYAEKNIEIEVKTRCIEEKISQQQIADDIGTSGTYVSRLIKHQEKIVNKTFLAIMERLGYDVELTYEKRNEG